MAELEEAEFLRIVARHRMLVLHDSGVYRHLHFGRPGEGMESFSIVTWPNHLSISGDMGCFVFSRLEDMFVFFRSRVNPSYWHEKLVAVDRCSGSKEFDLELFRSNVREFVVEAVGLESFDELDAEKKEQLGPVLNSGDEYEAVGAIRDWDHDWVDFTDFFDSSCESYTMRFLFACRAIQWGVGRYDANNAEVAV